MSSNSLGKLIKIIWREKVKYRKRTSDYVNLKVRAKTRERRHINDLDEEALKEIQLLCHEHGWLFDKSQIGKKVVFLMRLADRTSDGIVVNGQSLAFRITVNMDPQMNINLRSYGHPVTLQDIKGTQVAESLIDIIEEVKFLCEFAQPCIGGEIPNDESSPYKIPVGESNVISVISNERGEHPRLVSTSCLLIMTLGKLCSSCCYAMTLFNNRNLKRKVSNSASTPSKKCNIRFLDRFGLEEKIASQTRELRNEVKKVTRGTKNFEMLGFMEEDNSDLTRIFEGISTDTIPPSMKLIWQCRKNNFLSNPHEVIVGIHGMVYNIPALKFK